MTFFFGINLPLDSSTQAAGACLVFVGMTSWKTFETASVDNNLRKYANLFFKNINPLESGKTMRIGDKIKDLQN